MAFLFIIFPYCDCVCCLFRLLIFLVLALPFSAAVANRDMPVYNSIVVLALYKELDLYADMMFVLIPPNSGAA